MQLRENSIPYIWANAIVFKLVLAIARIRENTWTRLNLITGISMPRIHPSADQGMLDTSRNLAMNSVKNFDRF